MASNAGFVPLATHANQANLSTPRLKLLHESLILRELDRQNALDTSTPVNTGSSTIKGFLDQLIKDHRNNGTTLLKRGRGRALLHADVSYMTKVYEALAKKNIDGRRGSQTRCLFNNGSRVVLDHNKLILDALNAPLLTAAVAAPIVQTTNIQQNSLNPTTAQGELL